MTAAQNPYEVLGIARDATAQQIRRAYRRLAKTCHPDLGGDPAVFERLKFAHDLLIDPERRARYDATGDVTEAEPDNSHAEIVSFISVAMQAVVAQQGSVAPSVDFIRAVRVQLQEMQNAASKSCVQIQTHIDTWTAIVPKIHVKKNRPKEFTESGQTDRQNSVEAACRANIKALQDHLASHQKRIETIKRTLAFLDNFSFDVAAGQFFSENTSTTINPAFLYSFRSF